MTDPCEHVEVECLNHYDTFRKYRCLDCNLVYICECERVLALSFLPHQTREGSEYGTRVRWPVAGFAAKICDECRGVVEAPHPRAAIFGVKGKVERFYWREISKTTYEAAAVWLSENDETSTDINDFRQRFPEVMKGLKKDAKVLWQRQHESTPKYSLHEATKAELDEDIDIAVERIEAEHVYLQQGTQRLGAFVAEDGSRVGAEVIASEHFRRLGYDVVRCERAIPSTWYSVFFHSVVQDPSDPRQRRVGRMSTVGFGTSKHRPYFEFALPEDFGSTEYFVRRGDAFRKRLDELSRDDQLMRVFDSELGGSESLRDYLWAAEDATVAAAREVLKTVPHETVLSALKWVAGHYWDRLPGWPDFFIYDQNGYFFVEVKSKNDKLSQEQMRWIRWANDEEVPFKVLKVARRR